MSAARKDDGNPLAASLRRPANQNGAALITPSAPLTLDTPLDVALLHVNQEAMPEAMNQNAVMSSAEFLGLDKTCARVSRPRPPIHITCDLPACLPVLPAEVAIIETYLGDILNLLAANDNEPTP